jgi:hypothetical protein
MMLTKMFVNWLLAAADSIFLIASSSISPFAFTQTWEHHQQLSNAYENSIVFPSSSEFLPFCQ